MSKLIDEINILEMPESDELDSYFDALARFKKLLSKGWAKERCSIQPLVNDSTFSYVSPNNKVKAYVD